MTTPENNSTARTLSVGLSTQDARTGSAMGARPVRHSCHVKLPRYFSYFCAQPPRLLRLPCPSGEMAHHRPSSVPGRGSPGRHILARRLLPPCRAAGWVTTPTRRGQ
jgi:hypothetical protein